MMRSARAAFIVAVVAVGVLPLAGCESFDPTDIFDSFAKKPKLPGERKPVFPEGTPGVAQGVPSDLVKGAQPVDTAPVPPASAAEAAAEPEAKPEPKPKAKPKTKPKPKVAAAPEPSRATQLRATQSRGTPVTVRPSDSPWPEPPPNQSSSGAPSGGQVQWPDPPASGPR